MSRIVNFGVLGCGVIGPEHAKALRAIPEDAALVACCDIIPERAEKLAAENGGISAYTSLDEMLDHPGLDCICVCTPSGIHADAVLTATARGVSAMVEKPLDITTEKLDAIVEAAKTPGVQVGCIFQRRAWDVVDRVKQAMDRGALGTPVLAEFQLKWFRSQAYYDSGDWRGTWALDGGGALMNQGPHGADLLVYMMGPVQSVKAHMATRTHNIEVEDTLIASLRFDSGALGSIMATTSCVPGYDMVNSFLGERGTITLSENRISQWHVEGEESAATEGDAGPSASSDPTKLSVEGHARLLKDMAAAIRDDRPPMIPVEQGRMAVDLILACYESARTGREVVLAP